MIIPIYLIHVICSVLPANIIAQLSAEQHLSLPLVPYFNPKIESRSRRMMGEFESCLSDPW